MDIKERNKLVKSKLAEIFGHTHVSVRNGRGTTWGWCDIDIDIQKPAKCTCDDVLPLCEPCREAYRKAMKQAESAITGIEFYKYSDDMNNTRLERCIEIHRV
jgi:hypothetical protein